MNRMPPAVFRRAIAHIMKCLNDRKLYVIIRHVVVGKTDDTPYMNGCIEFA